MALVFEDEDGTPTLFDGLSRVVVTSAVLGFQTAGFLSTIARPGSSAIECGAFVVGSVVLAALLVWAVRDVRRAKR